MIKIVVLRGRNMREQEVLINAIHCVEVGLGLAVCEDCNLYPCERINVKDIASIVISALEKQIPEEPFLSGDGYWNGELVYDTWECPNCDKSYELDYEEYDYCPNCGQKIKWENI